MSLGADVVHTINGLALCQVVVAGAGEQTVAVSSNNTLNVAVRVASA